MRRIIAGLGALALLTACSSDPGAQQAPEKQAEESAQSQPAEQAESSEQAERGEQAEQPAESAQTPEPSPAPREDPNFDPATCTAPVGGAYPCAGRPIPVSAQEITNVSSYGVATVVMPSGNIGCDIFLNGVTCVVESWSADVNPSYDPNMGGYVTAGVGQEGPAKLGQGTDTPGFKGGAGSPPGQVLPYGTVWYFGDYVLSSEKSGLTFWNASTGSGALIKRAGFFPFQR